MFRLVSRFWQSRDRRRRGWTFQLAAAVSTIVVTAGTSAVTVDFESIRPGTRWGSETGQQPGDSALSEGGVMVILQNFLFSPTQTEFFRAEVPDVQGRFVQTFPSQELTLDGIGVLFDFSGLGFDVDFASIEFVDYGGKSNVSVNGAPVHILDPLSDLPSAVAPGVTATVIGGTRIEFLSTGALIESVLVGGQELVIDNVVAVPEPMTLLLLLAGGTILMRRRASRADRIESR